MKYKILVVDDEFNILSCINRILEKEDYQVITASNEQHALSLLKTRKRFDLVISDLILKKSDGLTLLYGIRRKRPKIKTILMSGCSFTKKQISMLKVDAFIHKPFEIEELKEAVKKVLNK